MASTFSPCGFFCFRQFRVPTTLLAHEEFGFSFIFSVSLIYSICQIIFSHMLSLISPGLLQLSSNRAGVLYPKCSVNVFLKYCGYIGKTVKPFLKSEYPLNFPPVIANTHCRLVSSENFICPYA